MEETRIQDIRGLDVRFPTSRTSDGSDAVNRNPDHSLAYAVIGTSFKDITGYGITFTIGRGNDLVVEAIGEYGRLLAGRNVSDIMHNMGEVWHELVNYSPLRWLGPEKGITHLATAAVFNALWDIYGKLEKKPVWKVMVDLSPRQLLSTIDFHYIEDVLTREQAYDLLARVVAGKEEREAQIKAHGYPAYTTSAGWLGFSDAKLRGLLREKMALGWDSFKIKVGQSVSDDIRRLEIIREEIGYDRKLMIDANQAWDVPTAIEFMHEAARFAPLWVEEPTSPDDILGHAKIAQSIAPIGVATGEHCHNRVMFKQFLAQGAMQYCQLDACRLGGINESLAVLLMAAKYDVPVCPHAGALGLREVQQHVSIADYIAISASLEGRMLEYADSFQEAFQSPAVVRNGAYQPPSVAGLGVELTEAGIRAYGFPHGTEWPSDSTD